MPASTKSSPRRRGPTSLQHALLQIVILTKVDIGLHVGQSLKWE